MGKMEYDDDWQRNEKERTALRGFKPDLAPGEGGAEFAFRNLDKLEVDDDWQRNEKERTALRGFKPDTAPAGTHLNATTCQNELIDHPCGPLGICTEMVCPRAV